MKWYLKEMSHLWSSLVLCQLSIHRNHMFLSSVDHLCWRCAWLHPLWSAPVFLRYLHPDTEIWMAVDWQRIVTVVAKHSAVTANREERAWFNMHAPLNVVISLPRQQLLLSVAWAGPKLWDDMQAKQQMCKAMTAHRGMPYPYPWHSK